MSEALKGLLFVLWLFSGIGPALLGSILAIWQWARVRRERRRREQADRRRG